jgi:hypothetical protein
MVINPKYKTSGSEKCIQKIIPITNKKALVAEYSGHGLGATI